jgi:hypothetical protein
VLSKDHLGREKKTRKKNLDGGEAGSGNSDMKDHQLVKPWRQKL